MPLETRQRKLKHLEEMLITVPGTSPPHQVRSLAQLLEEDVVMHPYGFTTEGAWHCFTT